MITKLKETESEVLEYKKSTSLLKEGIFSISSILNKHNKGCIYFGVSDNGSIIGQQVSSKTLREISQGISNFIEPKIFPVITEQVINDKHIVLVEFEGFETPYSAYGEYRIRVADEDKKITRLELKKLFLKSSAMKWDTEESESTVEDVNDELIKNFYNSSIDAKRIKFKWNDNKDTLNKLGLLKNNKILNAGHIIFSNKAELPVKMGVFATNTKNTINDMNYIKTNFYDALDICETYFRNNTKWKVKFNDGTRKGFKREEIPEVPFKALREALLNSYIHRDMFSPIANELCIFKDRIEIFNPGEFNNEYDVADYLNGGGKSICRNKLLASIIYLSEDIEAFGTGLKRINDLCKESDVKADFIQDSVGFTVVFWRRNVEVEYKRKFDFDLLNEQEQKIVLYLEENGTVTRRKVEELLKLKKVRVVQILNVLLEKEIIEIIGHTNKSKYILR